MKDGANLIYNRPEIREELLHDIVSASYENDEEEEEQLQPGETNPQNMPEKKLMETQKKRTSLSKMSGSLHKHIMKRHLSTEEPKKKKKKPRVSANQHPMFRKFFAGNKK